MTSKTQRYRPRFDAVALSTVPPQSPTAISPARAHNCAVWDECKVLSSWRFCLPKLAIDADNENFKRRHDDGLDHRRVGWVLALLVQRCFEPQTTEQPVLAWAQQTPDIFWERLGFPRRPTDYEVCFHLVPMTRSPFLRRKYFQSSIRRIREIIPASHEEADYRVWSNMNPGVAPAVALAGWSALRDGC